MSRETNDDKMRCIPVFKTFYIRHETPCECWQFFIIEK